MEPGPQLTDIADAIRLAVTPIFLLAGVGITINILIARLGRIVDRARVLEGQQQAADARPAVETELRVLSRHHGHEHRHEAVRPWVRRSG